MATVTKDFKIKSGLIVEGATATVNNYSVLTKSAADVNYIIAQVGGSGVSTNTPSTLVLRDANGDFAAGTITAEDGFVGDVTGDVVGSLTGNVTGNADTATTLETARTISISGDATGSVSFDGSSNVDIAVTLDSSFATDLEVSAAQTAAESFATSADTALYGTVTTDIATAKGEAISTASADATSKANAAETAAKAYTDTRETAITSAYQSYADQAEADAKTYADAAVSALIDGAPELLDTLNELAAAIADDENFATTVVSDIATGVQAAKDYSDSQDALQTTALQAYADQAELDAVDTANAYTDAEVAALAATVTALDTDDVAEGTNLYFTTDRAEDAAGNLLANATLENIQISYDSGTNALSITAENGVADSDTDDLAEGATNLYFTNQRARDAVAGDITTAIDALDTDDIEEGSSNLYFTNTRAQDAVATDIADAVAAGDGTATPTYFAVDINSVSQQVAATQTVETASQVVALSWDSTDYRSAELLVKVVNGTHSEVSKVLLTMDSSDNIAITEYGVVGTNGSMSTISAGLNAGVVELLVTTANNSSDVTVAGTLLI